MTSTAGKKKKWLYNNNINNWLKIACHIHYLCSFVYKLKYANVLLHLRMMFGLFSVVHANLTRVCMLYYRWFLLFLLHTLNTTFFFNRQPSTAKWYDRRDSVFIEFCVEDSKDVDVKFDKSKLSFRYVFKWQHVRRMNTLFSSGDASILSRSYVSYFMFSCVGGVDSIKYHNEVELFEAIDPNVSKLAGFLFFFFPWLFIGEWSWWLYVKTLAQLLWSKWYKKQVVCVSHLNTPLPSPSRIQNTNVQTGRCTAVYEKQNLASRGQG